MTKKLTILTFIFLLFGCSTRQDKFDEVYFVIKHPIKLTQDIEDFPAPPVTYYGYFNFILLDSTTIYFHKQHIYQFCGTGIDDTKPPRIFLAPDSLKILKIDDLPHFLTTSITDSFVTNKHFFASISSPTDTIRNRGFKTITDFFKSKKIRGLKIRNWTEEEQFVTTAKIENKKYNPDLINWKIGFDFVIDPPVISKQED